MCKGDNNIYLGGQYIGWSTVLSLLFILCVFSMLGIEPRSSGMLGKCSTTELYPKPYSIFFYIYLFNFMCT